MQRSRKCCTPPKRSFPRAVRRDAAYFSSSCSPPEARCLSGDWQAHVPSHRIRYCQLTAVSAGDSGAHHLILTCHHLFGLVQGLRKERERDLVQFSVRERQGKQRRPSHSYSNIFCFQITCNVYREILPPVFARKVRQVMDEKERLIGSFTLIS